MRCQLFQKSIAVICFMSSVYLNVLCHTVTSNTEHNVSSLQSRFTHNRLELLNFKREAGNIENINHTAVLNVSDDKNLVPASNRTFQPTKSSGVSEYNATGNFPSWMANIKSGALERTGFVALGFMLIVVVFFVVRAIRLRHKKSKSRKYGIITSTVSDMEMEPLDKDDDEEEDTTLFDAQHKYSLQ